MKFGDKLIALRKKNGLSQEDLAEKLKVSRQSISKWESNNTYPETDKLVMLCNVFNCTMDDLINDDITNIDEFTKKGNNIKIDSFLEFITKSVNMFYNMTFMSGLKCVLELIFVAFISWLVAIVVIGIFGTLINNLFEFTTVGWIIQNVFNSLAGIAWGIFTIIIVIHIFKIRYLDYYDKNICSKGKKEEVVEEDKKERIKFKEKNQKIIIRDPEDKSYSFLNVLSNGVMLFVKFMALMLNICFIFLLIGLIIGFIILLPISIYSMFIFGIDLAILATCICDLVIILLLLGFIFNKKFNSKIMLITFISSVVLCGIGIGIGFIGLKDLKMQEIDSTNNLVTYEEKLVYEDKLYINSHGGITKYIIDNSIEDNKIIINKDYDENVVKMNSSYVDMDKMKGYVLYEEANFNFRYIYDVVVKNLKNNIIINYTAFSTDEIVVMANKNTIDKLINNLDKMYIYDREDFENGFILNEFQDKVIINYGFCDMVEYDANKGSLLLEDNNCSCTKKEVETSYGTRVTYDCNMINEEESE